jgi:hypothetical protein
VPCGIGTGVIPGTGNRTDTGAGEGVRLGTGRATGSGVEGKADGCLWSTLSSLSQPPESPPPTKATPAASTPAESPRSAVRRSTTFNILVRGNHANTANLRDSATTQVVRAAKRNGPAPKGIQRGTHGPFAKLRNSMNARQCTPWSTITRSVQSRVQQPPPVPQAGRSTGIPMSSLTSRPFGIRGCPYRCPVINPMMGRQTPNITTQSPPLTPSPVTRNVFATTSELEQRLTWVALNCAHEPWAPSDWSADAPRPRALVDRRRRLILYSRRVR